MIEPKRPALGRRQALVGAVGAGVAGVALGSGPAAGHVPQG